MLPENLMFTSSVSNDLEGFFSKNHFSRTGILVDENTKKHCLPLISSAVSHCGIIEIKSGEVYKNVETCNHIWTSMTNAGFDRSSLLINLGGGVICDMGGFCAATFKRGIEFINIPTTLLAQVDASIGGKTGIDFLSLKNQLGVFSEPFAVIIDPVFLSTQDKRHVKSGFAEIIKHSLIADNGYFQYLLTTSFDEIKWDKVIQRSIEIKHSFVVQDPFEEEVRKSLNFGHTIGHALESYYMEKNNQLLHGEAVAAGLLCESFVSALKLGLPDPALQDISKLIVHNFGCRKISPESQPEIMNYLKNDKKNIEGRILMTLISGIGKVKVNVEVSVEEIEKSFSFYNHLVKA
ncbi:MAG TPA: 3-dehydroquinate synthase [Cyclobacteriaceae bacterium]|jgi:3-dehydroquinate synthase